MHEVVLSRTAEKQLWEFSEPTLGRLLKAMRKLENNPYPAGVTKLVGKAEPLWRIRVADYRIIYSVAEEVKVIDIRQIGHRKDIYR